MAIALAIHLTQGNWQKVDLFSSFTSLFDHFSDRAVSEERGSYPIPPSIVIISFRCGVQWQDCCDDPRLPHRTSSLKSSHGNMLYFFSSTEFYHHQSSLEVSNSSHLTSRAAVSTPAGARGTRSSGFRSVRQPEAIALLPKPAFQEHRNRKEDADRLKEKEKPRSPTQMVGYLMFNR